MPLVLHSPISGRVLHADTPHSLTCDGERWPVIDGIAYLRINRSPLIADVLGHLDNDRKIDALVILLADQDDWWTGEIPSADALKHLVAHRDLYTFRAAVAALAYGRVGSYFLHRWSDPTFLAGLALLEAHWRASASTVFELACGAGHYLREIGTRGIRATGADVVFAKLWLARHWVVGSDVDLVCFDAGGVWPLQGCRYDCVMCHDAFYFIEPKTYVLDQMRAVMAHDGWSSVAHVHNREHGDFSAGMGLDSEDLERLFPDGKFYADEELTSALHSARVPEAQEPSDLRATEAFSIAFGPGLERTACAITGRFSLPPAGAYLQRNPIYEDGRIVWPSQRYRDEYGSRVTYPSTTCAPATATASAETVHFARSRELLDLPARW